MNATRAILAYALGFCSLVLLARLAVGLGATSRGSRYIFVEVDQAGFLALVVLVAVATAVAWRAPRTLARLALRLRLTALRPWRLSLAVLALTLAGTALVHHGFALTMDEFMTRFQGEIFGAGRLTGRFPPEWRAYGPALMPVYSYIDPATGLVASSYRPGMALIYALFELAGAGTFAGAFLAAGSVVLIAAVARLIWPGDMEAAVVAALLLATSQQVLAMAMTSYAMPAHLFFNLLWLWLFLRDTRSGHLLAPFVGVFTAALHQVHVHALFALPFLLMLARPVRPGLIAWYGLVYVAGHLLILNWGTLVMPEPGAVASGGPPADLGTAGAFAVYLDRIARLPSLQALGSVFVNLVRFVAWQSPALLPLLLMVAWRKDRGGRMLAMLAASIALSFAPYPFMVPDPQHGWGYRYLHGVIGNVALLGAAGWIALRARADGWTTYRGFVLVLLLAGPLLLIPLRAERIEKMVRAYARATAFVERQDADVVVVDPYRIFYGRDLRRNDPFLRNRPVVLTLDQIPEALLGALCAEHSVTVITAVDIAVFGVPTATPERGLPEGYAQWLATLGSAECGAD